ncbi:MAG TPA: HypC/HybG/HupF family hydrogenase formation chaperone [bacterium]|nr:HypC/HybG/HupF family hydrogenase formation chaperone [bacterium]
MCLAMPGKVLSVDEAGTSGRVDVLGTSRTVDLSLVSGVAPGEWVLVQMGSAVARMSPEDAAETVELFEELGEVLAGLETREGTGAPASSSDAAQGECEQPRDPEKPAAAERTK